LGFFGLSGSNIHACIAKLCGTQLGQMANNLVTGPVGAVSGGFIPPLCPVAPTPAQAAAMQAANPGGAAATAAMIKASEADAKARVAAVEYLGTVDCTRWKEATLALKNALRDDPNECVRYAAARALGSGCCCNKDTIDALRACVSGEATGGSPAETSVRVKAAAFDALQNCLAKVPEVLPVEKPVPIEPEPGAVPREPALPVQPLRPERSTMSHGDGTHIATSLRGVATAVPTSGDRVRSRTFAETVNEARQTMFEVARTTKAPNTLPTGKRSVFNAFVKARRDISNKSGSPPSGSSPAVSNPEGVPGAYSPGTGPG
jgi:hypothetical protein